MVSAEIIFQTCSREEVKQGALFKTQYKTCLFTVVQCSMFGKFNGKTEASPGTGQTMDFTEEKQSILL